MAKGMKVNRPKTSLQKNLQKLGRVNKQKRKKQKPKIVKEDVNANDPLMTSSILKKRRTNPKANITLSGKKRRLLIKKHKKDTANAMKMEVANSQKKNENGQQNVKKSEKMEVE